MRHALAFLAAAAAATTLVAGAAASGAGSNVPLRLTSSAEIQRYLASTGVDPRTVVVQRGHRNYAGPNCPGKGWNCTKARRVVQIGYHHSPNVFQCSPAGPGTNPATGTCVIVQSNTTAANVAVCRMQTTAPTVSQTCSITQVNEQGANRATVNLLARLRGASPHEGVQTADVTQSNGSGLNNLNSFQKIDAYVVGGAVQKQEGHQDLVADQTTTSGNNNSQVKQFQVLRGSSSVNDGLLQQQNADNEGPNLDADVEQDSTSGKNTSLLDQGTNYNLLATSRKGPVEQRQGSPSGGLHGNIEQSSSGPSTSTNFQDEDLNAHARTPSGTLTQVQFGPAECCTEQLGNPDNVFEISQESMLFSDGGTQSSLILGSCITSGTCSVDQVQRTDDDFETNSDSCTATYYTPTCAVFIGIVCVPEEGCSPTEEGPSIQGRLASRER